MRQLILRRSQTWPRLCGIACLLFLWTSPPAQAAIPPGQPYTLQIEDRLDRLAVKYFEDLSLWPAILIATRAKAVEDSRYAKIYRPQQLQPGQMLWIPERDQIETLLAIEAARPKLQPLNEEMLTEFEAYVEAKRARYDIPGAVVVLVSGREVIYAQGFGARELGQSEPVTPETIFPVGSTTKSLNTTMIARLIDQGYLTWDQAVVEIWPDFALADPTQTRQLRLRDLLNMGSGVSRRDLAWSGAELTAEELLDSLAELPVDDRIGQRYHYNNQMVAAGGYLAIMATGGEYGHLEQAYAAQLQTQLFDPSGMNSATTNLAEVLANPNRATPHDLDLYGQVMPTHYHEDRSILPAGGVYANALDLGKFLQLHLNEGITADGRRIVSALNIRETQRPQTYISPTLSYGLGWFIEDFRGVDLVWHDGDVFGIKALIGIIPEAGIGVVILSNRIVSLVFNWSVMQRLVELLYDLPPQAEEVYDNMWAGFEANSANILAIGLSPTVDPTAVAPFVGPYQAGWRIELRGDRLYASRGPYEWQLLQAPDETFVVNNGYGIGMTLYLEEEATTGQAVMRFTLSTGEEGVYERVAGD